MIRQRSNLKVCVDYFWKPQTETRIPYCTRLIGCINSFLLAHKYQT